ncbi:MAG: TIGR00730 family Rossman fold protein [Dysgonamonadaceae bacterium]|jgi:uncharacterized protein (TIGR00730 family)|nr:TIGR00730 family Rossman fold protein [Dysgonamonadaceae bacterium]
MTQKIKHVTVFAASGGDPDTIYTEAAKTLGMLLAQRSIRCIYGGGQFGLMGAVSNSALDSGGSVCGIIPQFMIDRGWLNPRLSDVVITQDIHSRKRIMAERSDATVALPGGVGTMEELLEIITWRQLGLYPKPVIILNISGYYDFLLLQLRQTQQEKFLQHDAGDLFTVATTPLQALYMLIHQTEHPVTGQSRHHVNPGL